MSGVSNLTMRQVVRWPLHVIGMDPGRALANANPSETQRANDRDVLRRAIAAKYAVATHVDTPTRPITGRRFSSRRPGGARHNPYVDAGWWPRSFDLAGELKRLLLDAHTAGFDASRVTYRLGDPWIAPPRSVLVDGRHIKLSGYHNHCRDMVTLIDGATHERLEVMVIPPETNANLAERALQIAVVRADPTQGQDILALATDRSGGLRVDESRVG